MNTKQAIDAAREALASPQRITVRDTEAGVSYRCVPVPEDVLNRLLAVAEVMHQSETVLPPGWLSTPTRAHL